MKFLSLEETPKLSFLPQGVAKMKPCAAWTTQRESVRSPRYALFRHGFAVFGLIFSTSPATRERASVSCPPFDTLTTFQNEWLPKFAKRDFSSRERETLI